MTNLSYKTVLSTTLLLIGVTAFAQDIVMNNHKEQKPTISTTPVANININGVDFKLYENYNFFTWDNLPSDIRYKKMPIQEFVLEDGIKHYYEAVYVSSGNLNWFQAAKLAEDAGGYLASINSKKENEFIFNMVSDKKFFWSFPKYDGKQKHNHYEISIGPFLGGYQVEGSEEPVKGWKWLSGEPFEYTNWAKNLDDGVLDKDPRDNTQPNDSGDGQRTMGFGEMNEPVSTWGDYMDAVGTYGKDRLPGRSYAFVIEYNKHP